MKIIVIFCLPKMIVSSVQQNTFLRFHIDENFHGVQMLIYFYASFLMLCNYLERLSEFKFIIIRNGVLFMLNRHQET